MCIHICVYMCTYLYICVCIMYKYMWPWCAPFPPPYQIPRAPRTKRRAPGEPGRREGLEGPSPILLLCAVMRARGAREGYFDLTRGVCRRFRETKTVNAGWKAAYRLPIYTYLHFRVYNVYMNIHHVFATQNNAVYVHLQQKDTRHQQKLQSHKSRKKRLPPPTNEIENKAHMYLNIAGLGFDMHAGVFPIQQRLLWFWMYVYGFCWEGGLTWPSQSFFWLPSELPHRHTQTHTHRVG